MKERIPLKIVDYQVILSAFLHSPKLRITHRYIEFVIDTGSPYSFLNETEIHRLQIPIKDRISREEINIGGSHYQSIGLPKITMYLLTEDHPNKHVSFLTSLQVLKTTRQSTEKIQTAQALPSILGMDFLFEQKISLHVIPTENLAYLQCET